MHIHDIFYIRMDIFSIRIDIYFTFSLVNNCLGKFLNKIYIRKQSIHMAKKFSFSLSMLFFGKQSIIFRAKMNIIMAKNYTSFELKSYTKCTKRLSNKFCVKILPHLC